MSFNQFHKVQRTVFGLNNIITDILTLSLNFGSLTVSNRERRKIKEKREFSNIAISSSMLLDIFDSLMKIVQSPIIEIEIHSSYWTENISKQTATFKDHHNHSTQNIAHFHLGFHALRAAYHT